MFRELSDSLVPSGIRTQDRRIKRPLPVEKLEIAHVNLAGKRCNHFGHTNPLLMPERHLCDGLFLGVRSTNDASASVAGRFYVDFRASAIEK